MSYLSQHCPRCDGFLQTNEGTLVCIHCHEVFLDEEYQPPAPEDLWGDFESI